VAPAVRNLIHEVQSEAARVALLEARFYDPHAFCDRRLLHRDRDRVLGAPHGDANCIDALLKVSMPDRVGDDLRHGQLDVSDPGLELQDSELGYPSSRNGSRFRARDDFDLTLSQGLVFHLLPLDLTPTLST